jgi:hypothetical protein
MGITHREVDNLDRLPPGTATPGRTAPWAGWTWPRWDVVIAGGVVLVVLVLLVYSLLGAIWLKVPLGILFAALSIRGVLFVAQPGGWLVSTISALRTPAQPITEKAIEVHRVFAGTVPGPAQLTIAPHVQSARAPENGAQRALEAAPIEVNPAYQLAPADDWRRWMDEAPHLMIAGRTKAGKTTLATAIMIDRALAGDQIVVLDPHYQPGKWANLPTIGGGRDYGAILDVMPNLVQELHARYGEFSRGKPTESFQRLTVLIDELPAVVSHCMEMTPAGAWRLTDTRWIKFAKWLGSEARKVRISVILLTQSNLVQDILINTKYRANFLQVGLGDLAPQLIAGAQPARKAALYELLRGQQHPAAMEWEGEYHLLDTATVPALAARQAQAQLWTPPAAAQLAPTQRVTPPPSVPTQPMMMTNQELILDLLRTRPGLTNKEIAGATGISVDVVTNETKTMLERRALIRQRTREGNDKWRYQLPIHPPTEAQQPA